MQNDPKSPADQAYFLDMEEADTRAVLDRYALESQSVRALSGSTLDQSYGPHPRDVLEIFLPEETAATGPVPCVVFVHGGWWKGGCPQDRAMLAPAFTARGYGFASIGYPLAPEASLRDIVSSVKAGLAWLREHGPTYGLDMRNFLLVGNSAGGHLAAMLGAEACLRSLGIAPKNLKGLCLLSGLYDLAPLRETFADTWLRLDDDAIHDLSPVRSLPPATVPIFLGLGAREPSGFDLQRHLYADCLARAGHQFSLETIPGKNHFEVIEDIGTPGAVPFEFNLRQLERKET